MNNGIHDVEIQDHKSSSEQNSVNSSSRHSHIEIENSSQQVQQELSLQEISSVLFKNWPLFLLLNILFLAAVILYYVAMNPFKARTSLIVNDTQNSQLQSLLLNSPQMPLKVAEGKKANSTIQKRIEATKTTQFYDVLIKNIAKDGAGEQKTVSEIQGRKLLMSEMFKNVVSAQTELTEENIVTAMQFLDQVLKIKAKSDFEVEVFALHERREVALYLGNITVLTLKKWLTDKDEAEIKIVNDYLSQEKIETDLQMTSVQQKLKTFNDQPQNLISLGSREKVGEYLSELMVRKNETLMKLTENNKIIQTLSLNSSQKRESELYGQGGKIKALRLENELLRSKLGQIQTALDRVSQESKGMPYAAQMYEDLKKSSQEIYNQQKSLDEKISLLEQIKLGIKNKYEVFDLARFDKVTPSISLSLLLSLAFMGALICGSLLIYLRAIWSSNYITAEATRNVIVVDSHALDPRVIIENSKIRFRLKNKILEDDPEKGQTKKIGFNFNK